MKVLGGILRRFEIHTGVHFKPMQAPCEPPEHRSLQQIMSRINTGLRYQT